MICVATATLFNLILYTTASFGGPFGLLIPVIGVLLLKLPRKNVIVLDRKKVGVLRRILGFFIDVYVVLMSTVPIAAMFVLILEYIATGHWQWSFERQAFRWWTDIPTIFMSLLVFYGIYFYYKWWFVRGLQTLGQYLMGFKLVPTGETPMLSVRFLSACVILAWWPLWPWTLFKKRDGFLWDDYSRIKAVRMRKA